jgi:ABC-2 type transport system permease protein
MNGYFAILALDLRRVWLDRVRLATSLAQPLLYLFVLGSGIGGSSRLGGAEYLRFIFPGVVALSLLFTASFSAIVIVFDRQIGFLKAILIAPVSRLAIALGKVSSGALQALLQACVLLLFAPLAGVPLEPLRVLEFVLAMSLAAFTFSALGVAVASRFRSVTVFPIVSNAVLLPMFFLSGAMYPLENAPHWLRILARLDPVAYAVDLMRGALYGTWSMPAALSFSVLVAFATVLTLIAVFQQGEDE